MSINYVGLTDEYINRHQSRYGNMTWTAGSSSQTAAQSAANQNTASAFANTSSNKCTDEADDGKIGFFSAVGNVLEGVGKGIINCIKGGFTDSEGHFSIGQTLKTAAMTALCFVPVVGPAIGAGLACYGIFNGVSTVVKAVQVADQATTDAEAKAAFEQIGSGTLTAGLSVVGLKASAGALRSQLSANTTSTMVQTIRAKGSVRDIAKAAVKDTGKNAVDAARAVQKKASDTIKKAGDFADEVSTKGLKNTVADRAGKAYQRAKTRVEGWGDKLNEKAEKLQKDADAQLEASRRKAEKQAKLDEANIKKGKDLAKKHNVADADCYDNGVPKEIKDGNVTTKYNKNGTPKSSVETTKNVKRTVNGKEVTGTEVVTKTYDQNGTIVNEHVEFTNKSGKKTVLTDKNYVDGELVLNSETQAASTTKKGKTATAGQTEKKYSGNGKTGSEIIDADGNVIQKDVTSTKTSKINGKTTSEHTFYDADTQTTTVETTVTNKNGDVISSSKQVKNADGKVISSDYSRSGNSGSSYSKNTRYDATTKKTNTTTEVKIKGETITNPSWIDKLFAKLDSGLFGDVTSSHKLTPEFIWENPELFSELSVILADEETITY